MKAWRELSVFVSILSGLVVGCGPAGGAEAIEPQQVDDGEVGAAAARPWKACGDEARRVKDIRQGAVGSRPEFLVHGEGWLLFSADDGVHGRELWASRGDARRTVLVKDVRSGPLGSVPRFLTQLLDLVVFIGDDGVHGPELWRTDGTAEGTWMVKDVRPGPWGSVPEQLTVVDGVVYFTADDGKHGRELWRSDGTEDGTWRVWDFAPGPESLFLDELTAWKGQLALVASSPTEATLWTFDGWGEARRLYTTSGPGVLFELTPAGRNLFFLQDSDTGEADLWVTRKAPGTAVALRRFPGEYPAYLTPLDGTVYFLAGAEGFFGQPGDLEHGGELWRSDGTVLGTRVVRDIQPGPRGSLPTGLVALDGWLYFAADDGVHGRELWRSDGTLTGTSLVKDMADGPAGSDPEELAAVQGSLFFSAATAEHGREPWTSQGSSEQTRLLADLTPGKASSSPRSFVRSGWDVFFLASDGLRDQELWALPLRPGNRGCAK